MTRVDFYILAGSDELGLARLACRLVDKAWQRGLASFVHVDDAAAVARLDDLLWTFRDISFLPHARAAEARSEHRLAAVIGCGEEPAAEFDLLINLAAAVPDFFSRFERVAELVDDEPARRMAGRDRFRFYRDRGYPLDTHNLS